MWAQGAVHAVNCFTGRRFLPRGSGPGARAAWTRCVLGLAAAITALGPPATAQEAESHLPRLIGQHVGVTPEDADRVRAGEIVSVALPEAENELAVVIALLVPGSVGAFFEEIRSNDIFEVDVATLAAERVDEPSPSASLGAFELPGTELSQLREAEAGYAFNLTQAEAQALRGTETDAETLSAYRALLERRIGAYQKSGLSAIAPYDRGGEASRPSEELRAAVADLKPLAPHMPEFYEAFAAYPEASDEAVEHQLWWQLLNVEGRPTAVLSHRLFEERDDYAVLAARQYYVGRSYNSMQVIVGIFALRGEVDRSLVLYSNRTFTDRVAGFGSSARHRIGRGMLVREVSDFFRLIRERMAEKSSEIKLRQ